MCDRHDSRHPEGCRRLQLRGEGPGSALPFVGAAGGHGCRVERVAPDIYNTLYIYEGSTIRGLGSTDAETRTRPFFSAPNIPQMRSPANPDHAGLRRRGESRRSGISRGLSKIQRHVLNCDSWEQMTGSPNGSIQFRNNGIHTKKVALAIPLRD